MEHIITDVLTTTTSADVVLLLLLGIADALLINRNSDLKERIARLEGRIDERGSKRDS